MRSVFPGPVSNEENKNIISNNQCIYGICIHHKNINQTMQVWPLVVWKKEKPMNVSLATKIICFLTNTWNRFWIKKDFFKYCYIGFILCCGDDYWVCLNDICKIT